MEDRDLVFTTRKGILEEFGQMVLRPQREELQISQAQMARLIGVTQPQICRMEIEGQAPKSHMVATIAKHYKLSEAQTYQWMRLLCGFSDKDPVTPFLQYPHMSVAFDTALTQAEEYSGDRLLIKGGPSVLVEPLDVLEERIASTLAKHSDERTVQFIDVLLVNRKRRWSTFQEQIKHTNHRFYDIYSRSAFEKWADSGLFELDDWLVKLGGELESGLQTIRHIKHLIGVLENYRNYHIAFLTGEAEAQVNTFVEIKGQRIVVMEKWRRTSFDEEPVQEDFIIREPITVEAHTQRFHRLWDSISDEYRNKAQVIEYLKTLLERVERRT